MKQILCFGDSNTWGYNPQNGQRFPWGIRWTSLLQENMGKTRVRIIEEGLCGRTTVFEDELRAGRKGNEMLPVLLESYAPLDAIVLMLGTNDCKKIYHANEYIIGSGIEKLIDIIRKIQPDVQILLVSPIWLGDDVWKKEFDPEFDSYSVEVSHNLKDIYKEIAQKQNIHFLAASDYVTYSKEDMEHMDAKNHKIFAEIVEKTLNEILE